MFTTKNKKKLCILNRMEKASNGVSEEVTPLPNLSQELVEGAQQALLLKCAIFSSVFSSRYLNR